MKRYFVKYIYKEDGGIGHWTALTSARGKATEKDIRRWMNELKEMTSTKSDIIIENIIELEEEKECEYKEFCPSRSEWCERKNPNYEQCIGFVLAAHTRQRDEMKHWQQEADYWKREAIVMAAAAGEAKIEEYEKNRSRTDEGDGRGIRQQESV